MSDREINRIVIHCSVSEWGSAAEIRNWHIAQDWDDIGYHFVIGNGYIRRKDLVGNMRGNIEVGRPLSKPGAHARGFNRDSIGICVIGNHQFHMEQFESLVMLVKNLQIKYGVHTSNVLGHNELPGVTKTCPNFRVEGIRQRLDFLEEWGY